MNGRETKSHLTRELKEIRLRMAELNKSATQNRLAEEELVKSEERYRNLVELSPDMIALHSRGKYVYVNPAGIKMLGASGPEDLIGKSTLETIHLDSIGAVKERVRQLEQGKAVPLLEEKYIRLDGTVVDVEVAAAPISSQDEPMVQVIARDITERRRAEEALRRSEEEAKNLAQENAVVAEIGRIISSTPDIEEVYERFAQEVQKLIPVDRCVFTTIHPEDHTATNVYASGIKIPSRLPGEIFPLAGSATEKAQQAKSGRIIPLEDEAEVAAQVPGLLPSFRAGIRSAMMIPLISRDQVIGVLHLQSIRPKGYTPKDLRIAERIGNQIAGAVANARLYSQLKEAKESLQKKEEEFRELYDHAPLGYHEYNQEGKITRVNNTDLEMLGYSPEEMIGQPIWKFNVGEELVQEQVLAKLAGRLPPGKNLVRTYRRKDGSTLPVLIEDRLLQDERGRIVGIRCTIQDITERKRVEEALRKSEEEAQKLAHEYAVLAEIGRIVSSTLSIDEVYKLFSEEVKKLLPFDWLAITLINQEENTFVNRYIEGISIPGRNQGQTFPSGGSFSQAIVQSRKGMVIQNKREDEILAEFPSLFASIKAGIRSFLSVPLISRDQVMGIIHFRSKKDKTYSEKDLKLAENIANQIAGAVANAQLFSKHLRTEEEKAALEEQLRQSQKMEAIGRLAGGISHDFNNLLTVINSNSELALMELKEWDPLREKVESIQKAGGRAANLTRQLLAFSRRQVVEMKVIDLNALLQDLGKMLLRIIGEDIELNIVPGRDLGRVKADPGQIEQAIINLVVNARDAMPSGGKLTIHTTNMELDKEYTSTHFGVKPGRYVMLSVSDTGVGMVPEVRERIFEPFFTTKEKGKGTGLGLSTVYGIVKQSGGDIWVYSEPGHGTIFKIYLPRVDEPLEEGKKKVLGEKLPGGSETILIVEDEEEVRKLAVAILKKQGYRILEAAHGGDALPICEKREEPIHLLLTDIVMPAMNGLEVAKRLRCSYPELKVLLMSGYSDNAIVEQSMLDDGMFFLEKPFSVDGLIGKVRQALDSFHTPTPSSP